MLCGCAGGGRDGHSAGAGEAAKREGQQQQRLCEVRVFWLRRVPASLRDCALFASHIEHAHTPLRRAAKLIGDRRADVAIRSFGRPYNKIVVAESGPLE